MTPIIELSHVTYSYPNSETPALNDLSLTINQGEWIAIIGHNGSGKSTLAKLLNYLLAPTAGEITIAGTPVNEDNMWTIRDLVGMVFQNPDNQLVATIVEEEVGMAKFADREPARLSGGQKQRVAIASVLAIQPQILILDEATAMLDPKGRREMIALVHDLKRQLGDALTVISITHDIEEAASADRVVVINDGDLMQTGTPEDVFANAEKLREFGLAVPFAEQLKEKLRERGIDVPDSYLTTEGMVDWLWQSISTK